MGEGAHSVNGGGWGVALQDKGCVCGTGLHAEDRVGGRGEEENSCGE